MADDFPGWIVNEIQNAEFTDTKTVDGTGYILELYKKDGKADIQLYEPVEDGRHIITTDMVNGIKTDTLEKGAVYHFMLEQHKAPLSKKAVKYLQSEKDIEMEAIYRFELRSFETIDTGADDR